MKENNSQSRLQVLYHKEIAPNLLKTLSCGSIMAVPRLLKIHLNMGVGEALAKKDILDHAMNDMRLIAGQQPIITRARKSVAGFKIREGWPIGCTVTLRGRNMYQFFDRLINVAIPRIRDFRGINVKSFDKFGNLSMGISEQIIFPEINYDKIDEIRGMDITIVSSGKNVEHTRALLAAFKFPFRN